MHPPFRLLGLDHVVLRIVDLPKALGFYRDILGLPVEKEQPDFGLIQLRAGRSLIDLVTLDGVLGKAGGKAPGHEGRNVDHVAIEIDPFDETAIRSYLVANNIKVDESGTRYGARGYGPSLYILDPEGNRIELKGPPDVTQAIPIYD